MKQEILKTSDVDYLAVETVALVSDLDSVIAALLTPEGVMVEANHGFRELLREQGLVSAIDLRGLFVNPPFERFAARRPERDDGVLYSGILTLGRGHGTPVSLTGSVRAVDGGLLCIAEYSREDAARLAALGSRLSAELAQRERELRELGRQLRQARAESARQRQLLTKMRTLLLEDADQATPVPASHEGPIARLTRREQDVLARLAEGMSSKEVGRVLRISERTVETHRANIMRKTGTRSFAALLRLYFVPDAPRGKPASTG